jgi:hypothetical protein
MEELIRFVRESAAIDDPLKLAERALAVGMAVIPSRLGWIHVRRREGSPLDVRRASGEGPWRATEREAFRAVVGAVLKNRQIVLLESTSEDGLEAIGLPLRSGHDVIGALVVGGTAGFALHEGSQEEGELLADQISQALARLAGPAAAEPARVRGRVGFARAGRDALVRWSAEGTQAAWVRIGCRGRGAARAVARLASTAASLVRPDDLVGRRDARTIDLLIQRMEPEEFVGLARRMAQVLRDQGQHPFVGAALFPDDADYFEALEAGVGRAFERAARGRDPSWCLPQGEPRPLDLAGAPTATERLTVRMRKRRQGSTPRTRRTSRSRSAQRSS